MIQEVIPQEEAKEELLRQLDHCGGLRNSQGGHSVEKLIVLFLSSVLAEVIPSEAAHCSYVLGHFELARRLETRYKRLVCQVHRIITLTVSSALAMESQELLVVVFPRPRAWRPLQQE